jgi:hypothetical protein
MKSAVPDDIINWLGCCIYTLFTRMWQDLNYKVRVERAGQYSLFKPGGSSMRSTRPLPQAVLT